MSDLGTTTQTKTHVGTPRMTSRQRFVFDTLALVNNTAFLTHSGQTPIISILKTCFSIELYFFMPTQDKPTVSPTGERLESLIEGVHIRYAITHPDERGTLTEIYNPAWGFDAAPLVYLYEFTIRPGKVKGWIVHHDQDDRIFALQGTVKFVLYDDRPASPTYKMLNTIFLSDQNRGLITYPRGVYHALQNIGETTARLINLPTAPYNHAEPDKYRLPFDTDYIPYRFDDPRLGW
jgi:dTDP-4-dehydrorhamnose 3,5-epimerase